MDGGTGPSLNASDPSNDLKEKKVNIQALITTVLHHLLRKVGRI